jgi:hypothetical protein
MPISPCRVSFSHKKATDGGIHNCDLGFFSLVRIVYFPQINQPSVINKKKKSLFRFASLATIEIQIQ